MTQHVLRVGFALSMLDLGYWLFVNTVVDPPLVSLRLLDTEARTLLAEDISSLGPQEDDLHKALAARASGMFDRSGYPRADRVTVTVEPKEATWELYGDKPLLRKGGVLLLKKGSYRLLASSPGFLSVDRSLQIGGGAEQNVTMNLKKETNIMTSPWLWTGVGAAVVAATIAIVVVAQPGPACLCIAQPDASCDDC